MLSELEKEFAYVGEVIGVPGTPPTLIPVDDFWQGLKDAMATYDPKVYKAPYFTFVQGVGCGKSRYVKEVAQSHPLIYISPDHEKAYPRGIEEVHRELMGIRSVEEALKMLRKLIALGTHLWKKYTPTNANHNLVYWMSMEKFKLRDWHQITVLERIRDIELDPIEACRSALAEYLNAVGEDLALLVIDEAQILLEGSEASPFEYLRDALKAVDCGSKLAALFLSATARICRFEPSGRPYTDGKLLFPPILTLPSWISIGMFLCSSIEVFLHVHTRGRPLWTTMSFVRSILQTFALAKTILEGPERDLMILAALGACIHPRFGKGVELQEKMVRSYGALLLHVDEDRETLKITYPPEPVLTTGSIQLLTHLPLSLIFEVLAENIRAGVILRPAADVLVGALRCIGARLSCREPRDCDLSMIHFDTVEEFIIALTGLEGYSFNGHLLVMGFVYPKVLSKADLKRAASDKFGVVTHATSHSAQLLLAYNSGSCVHNSDFMAIRICNGGTSEPERMEYYAALQEQRERLGIGDGINIILDAAWTGPPHVDELLDEQWREPLPPGEPLETGEPFNMIAPLTADFPWYPLGFRSNDPAIAQALQAKPPKGAD